MSKTQSQCLLLFVGIFLGVLGAKVQMLGQGDAADALESYSGHPLPSGQEGASGGELPSPRCRLPHVGPSGRIPVIDSTAASEVPHICKHSFFSYDEGPPSVAELEDRYGQLNALELNGARLAVISFASARTTGLLKAKMERGEYTSQIVAEGQPMDQKAGFSDGTSRIASFEWMPTSDGLLEFRVAEMSSSEDPQVEAMYVEIAWLSTRMYQLSDQDD